jgi:two-component system sensor histidine kinase KdpD
VQHIESLVDPVERIVGRVPAALVPDRFLDAGHQIELVDITPEAIRRRVAHGNVFTADHIDPAGADLFNSDAFARLRALLLYWMADRLDVSRTNEAPEAHEHVVVAVTGAPGCDAVIRRAVRLAQRSRARVLGVHVGGAEGDAGLVRARALLADLGATFHRIEGDDVAAALVAFAEAEGATQLVLGTSGARGASARGPRSRGSIVDRVLRSAGHIDVHVVSLGPDVTTSNPIHWTWAPAVLSRRRRLLALVGGAVGMTVLTALLVELRDVVSVSTGLALYLLAVVSITAVGGRLPGVLTAIAAPLLANWFLVPPYHTLRVNDTEDALELVVFVSVAVIVSAFVSVSSRRAIEAESARREAATLAALAGSGGPDALQSITEQLRQAFALDGVAVIATTGEGREVVASSGAIPHDGPHDGPRDGTDAAFHEPLGPDVVLVGSGRALSGDDHRVLRAFVLQLARAVEQHRLAELAAEADALGRADELRTAILRAVSHDLRSPLASIKASASSLRQADVHWPDEVREEFLASIEDETDRLTEIVTNLLDMSRLQAGVVRPVVRPVALEEVVPAALHSLGGRADGVELLLPAGTADVAADPALLERVVANLIANAVAWSPPQTHVRVLAHQREHDVQLHVIDHGPGIRPKERATVLQPFHRLSDSPRQGGVGLGLAIADGLTTAMGGHLELRDTPRGGLTAVVTLPIASGTAG